MVKLFDRPITQCRLTIVVVCFVLAGCASTSEVRTALSASKAQALERAMYAPNVPGTFIDAAELPLSLSDSAPIPSEEAASLPVSQRTGDLILRFPAEKLDDRCDGIHAARAEANRRLVDSGNQSMGPIEPKVELFARPAQEKKAYLQLLEGSYLTSVESAAAVGGEIRIRTYRTNALQERIGPAMDIIEVKKYPPVSGAGGAVATAVLSPLMALMTKEERREHMMSLGCETETRIGVEVLEEESLPTGRVAFQSQPIGLGNL